MTALISQLVEFFRNVRFADLLDVLLVAVLIYIAISWLRSGASRTVVVIITSGVALFVAANALNMYVTQALLEVFFAVFIVTFVVLFQGEIRRELDRLTTYGLRWRVRRRAAEPAAHEIIAHVAERLAREKVGALIVVRGRESVDHLVDGGVALRGDVSEPLLCSLFNPDSPGHDGAVLIQAGRVARFGTHLPLSTNLIEIGPRGTRHAAALGLSERCDALVIVVSEERGEISVVEQGRLQPLHEPGALRSRLRAFWSARHAPRAERIERPVRWREAAIAASALILSAIFWLMFAYQSEVVYRSWLVPVEFRNLPAGLTLEDPPSEVRLTLGGSSQAMRRVEPGDLVVQLDVTNLQIGWNQIPIGARHVRLPPGVWLDDVEDGGVGLRARAAGERRGPPAEP